MRSNIIKSSFGRKQLIQETLLKCSQALEGDLIELMTGVISKSLEVKMLEMNKGIEKDIKISIDLEVNLCCFKIYLNKKFYLE